MEMLPKNYRLAVRATWQRVARHVLFGTVLLVAAVWIADYRQVWQWQFEDLFREENGKWLAGMLVGFSVGLEECFRAVNLLVDRPGEVKPRPSHGGRYLWTDSAAAYFLCCPIGLALLAVLLFGTWAEVLAVLPLWICFAWLRYRLHGERILYVDYAADTVAVCRFGWFWWQQTERYDLHDFCGIAVAESRRSADVLLVGRDGKADLRFEHITLSNFRYLAMRAQNKLRRATGLPVLHRAD